MTKYNPTQLIKGIESLVNSETNDCHLLLTEVQAAIQKRQKEIIGALGVNVFEAVTPETQIIRDKIAQYLLRADKKEKSIITLDTGTETQAALERVEELKRRYTPEQIVEMRKLRAEVEEMVSSVSKNDAETVLEKYGISIYRGYKVDGSASEFLKNSMAYRRWREAGVIFKSDLRKLDKKLVTRLNHEVHYGLENDLLMTESHLTEMVAAGIFGDEKQRVIAEKLVYGRSIQRQLVASIRALGS